MGFGVVLREPQGEIESRKLGAAILPPRENQGRLKRATAKRKCEHVFYLKVLFDERCVMVLDVVEGRTRIKQQKKDDVEERMENAFQLTMDMKDCGVSYDSNKVLCTSTYDVRHRHTYLL